MVPKRRGEFFRKIFTEAQLINQDLIIKHNEGYLFIPLRSHPKSIKDNNHLLKLLDEEKIEIIENGFNQYPNRITDYKALIDLPNDLSSKLPTSYDVIGSIALIKIPNELIESSKIIGEAILKVHKNIRTVALDKGVRGDYRIRNIEIIAGEQNTQTSYKEYGIELTLDISKVYFSPRLGSEHWRITQDVQPGEIVLDMFAGVGPFSIMIAKYSKAKEIYSIDLNKYAIQYLIKNIDINKVTNIFPLEGDVKERIKNLTAVDRVIMNLPLGGDEYLPLALSVLKNYGKIHYHEMLSKNQLARRKAWIESTINNYDTNLISSNDFNLGSYSSKVYHYCFDLVIRK